MFRNNHTLKAVKKICVKALPLLAIFCFFTVTLRAQQPATEPREWMLSKIDASGLNRYTLEQVAQLSELKIGQKVDLPILDAATLRLRETGLFNKVSYGYRYRGDQLTITFKVEEVTWDTPVVFDNFVWFTDEELIKAVAQTVPSFAGLAPKSGNVTALIVRALEQLLKERNLPGAVEYLSSADMSGAHLEHIFTVKNLSLPVCGLHFPRAAGVKESDLINAVKTTVGGQYSKNILNDFARNHLLDLYREHGYLKANFISVMAKLSSDPNCKNGADVAILIDEGMTYTVKAVEWSGNSAVSNKELDELLGVKAGEVANGVKLNQGLKAIKTAYGKRGYIRTATTMATAFDDAARHATLQITLHEGAQYHMGQLTFNGLPQTDAERLQKRWKLKPGDIFDSSYLSEFLVKELDPKLNSRIANIKATPLEQNLTIDVTINFK